MTAEHVSWKLLYRIRRVLQTSLKAVTPTVSDTAMALAASADDVRRNFPIALALSSLAGAFTGVGGMLVVMQRDISSRRLGVWQGAAAGFMLSVSFMDLAPSVLQELPWNTAIVFFLAGAALFSLLKKMIPEPDLSVFAKASDANTRQVLWSGLLTAIGISLHNFPEGMAVCVASLRGLRFGLPLAIAIALHNLPEGMAVALPIFYATKSKSYAVKLAFLSGLAEPAGVIFVLGVIHILGSLTKATVAIMLAFVAGVMVGLSVIELFPQACLHAGRMPAIWSTTSGFAIMAALLVAIEKSGLGV